MTEWVCRLSESSYKRYCEELALTGAVNDVTFQSEANLPRSHARQVAADAFRTLARQHLTGIDRQRLHTLIEGLDIHCDPVILK